MIIQIIKNKKLDIDIDYNSIELRRILIISKINYNMKVKD